MKSILVLLMLCMMMPVYAADLEIPMLYKHSHYRHHHHRHHREIFPPNKVKNLRGILNP